MARLTSWRVTDRVVDQGLVVRGELAEVGLDAADQLPQLGDLVVARVSWALAQSCRSVAAWTRSRPASSCCGQDLSSGR
jgi:hypothetical protein